MIMSHWQQSETWWGKWHVKPSLLYVVCPVAQNTQIQWLCHFLIAGTPMTPRRGLIWFTVFQGFSPWSARFVVRRSWCEDVVEQSCSQQDSREAGQGNCTQEKWAREHLRVHDHQTPCSSVLHSSSCQETLKPIRLTIQHNCHCWSQAKDNYLLARWQLQPDRPCVLVTLQRHQ